MKIEMFDFRKNWHLVEPHLNDPKILKELDKGMKELSIFYNRESLPIWNRKNGIGPWEYSMVDNHSFAIKEKALNSEEYKENKNKIKTCADKSGLCFEDIFKSHNQLMKSIISAIICDEYNSEMHKLYEKFEPKEGSYRWYQCFGACHYMAQFQKKLAKKTFPKYKWKIYRDFGDGENDHGHSTVIGTKNKNVKIIFDILAFEYMSIDEILEKSGFNTRMAFSNKYSDFDIN